ncbi:MAG TPA: hypothetical protein VHA37_03690, partial [Candidatus Saccharimonadales bacterium]|nr:hypothetical protein [Candidatus Saccharimonadales bacterium]
RLSMGHPPRRRAHALSETARLERFRGSGALARAVASREACPPPTSKPLSNASPKQHEDSFELCVHQVARASWPAQNGF